MGLTRQFACVSLVTFHIIYCRYTWIYAICVVLLHWVKYMSLFLNDILTLFRSVIYVYCSFYIAQPRLAYLFPTCLINYSVHLCSVPGVWLCIVGIITTLMGAWLCIVGIISTVPGAWLCIVGIISTVPGAWLCIVGIISNVPGAWLCIVGMISTLPVTTKLQAYNSSIKHDVLLPSQKKYSTHRGENSLWKTTTDWFLNDPWVSIDCSCPYLRCATS